MIRSVLTFLGALVILCALGLWHFGYLSKQINQVATTIDRQTAVARAESRIRQIEEQAVGIKEQSRQLRVQARARELALERDQETATKTRSAISQLAQAARDAGLPKPSAATSSDRAMTVSFIGKSLSGDKVYDMLSNWQRDLDRETRKHEIAKTTIERMRSAADRLESQRDRLLAHVNEVRGKLDELAMQRDLANVEAQLAELGANANGQFNGDLGKALETVQKEIDESLASVEVLGQESSKPDDITPDTVLEASGNHSARASTLDALWTDAKPK